jgi:hypothetical protein
VPCGTSFCGRVFLLDWVHGLSRRIKADRDGFCNEPSVYDLFCSRCWVVNKEFFGIRQQTTINNLILKSPKTVSPFDDEYNNEEDWHCSYCTFDNEHNRAICQMCKQFRPKKRSGKLLKFHLNRHSKGRIQKLYSTY